jgi:tRNA(fMet)-specific endonuclease VapC
MILGADVVIDLLRRHPPARAWLASLPLSPTISGVAALECPYGATDSNSLRRIEEFLVEFDVEWPTSEDSKKAADLASLHLSDGLGLLDALTAACALRIAAPVATFNVKHFRAIKGLTTVQPYDRG